MRNFPYKILIPSYQRAGRASTIDFLRGGVYGCEDIIVSTQTEDDYQAYKKAYAGKATIIYREGNSVGDNRNTLLEWAQKNGVSFADWGNQGRYADMLVEQYPELCEIDKKKKHKEIKLKKLI